MYKHPFDQNQQHSQEQQGCYEQQIQSLEAKIKYAVETLDNIDSWLFHIGRKKMDVMTPMTIVRNAKELLTDGKLIAVVEEGE